jgi:hypothetical protein
MVNKPSAIPLCGGLFRLDAAPPLNWPKNTNAASRLS